MKGEQMLTLKAKDGDFHFDPLAIWVIRPNPDKAGETCIWLDGHEEFVVEQPASEVVAAVDAAKVKARTERFAAAALAGWMANPSLFGSYSKAAAECAGIARALAAEMERTNG
jgi:hypothetical protein